MRVLLETFAEKTHIDARLTQLGATWKIGLSGELAEGEHVTLKTWTSYPQDPEPNGAIVTSGKKHFAIYVPK